ncbi:MAG: type I 3-dehydroquinate dehydratase [Akkermansiaceae bacterium]|nr:type I 3-dehydroquinate dehydratase [Akkermansiaceae bacterium]
MGSIGDADTLAAATPESLAKECDIAEIRLDLLHREFFTSGAALWQHLLPFPLLFTARCHSEGSPFDLDLETRIRMLTTALPDASLIDIEAMSASAMGELVREIISKDIPWVASYHDFLRLPSRMKLDTHAEIAREAGATAFKAAARMQTPADITELASFQMSDVGIPLATMGMGDLAPVSRLLCAQVGSVLNYGYIGEKETAPGQWSASRLRECIRSLKPIR